MRRTSFWMAVAAFLLVLTACGDKKANQGQNGEEVTDSLSENVEVQEDEDVAFSDTELTLRKIRETWSKESIDGLRPEENGVGIVDLALAFCEKYSDFEANKQLVNYFTRRDQFNSDWFQVDEQPNNGFVKCMSGSEVSRDVTACYWKKKDGHRLVAFWLELGHEGSEEVDCLLAFYDYDPEAEEMTPKPELTQRVEKTMSKFDSYSVRLPDKGKDIILIGHDFGDDDSYEATYYLFKWNGNDFDQKEVSEDEAFG